MRNFQFGIKWNQCCALRVGKELEMESLSNFKLYFAPVVFLFVVRNFVVVV